MKPVDKIYDAYFNGWGEEFGQKVRDRIHWICEQAKGTKVLDVGCSQGITSILLGREGKIVTGLDLIQESIDFANEKLKEEEDVTQQQVTFKQSNFMLEDFSGEKHDAIILSEVLEHITQPENMIEKAISLLSDKGRLVITVPFGINDFFDHKKTYYIQDLIKLIPHDFSISTIEVLGKWVGLTVSKTTETDTNYQELLDLCERSFYDIERALINENTKLKSNLKNLTEQKGLFSNKAYMLENQNQKLQQKLDTHKQNEQQLELKHKEIEALKKQYASTSAELVAFKKSAGNHKTASEKNRKLLIESLNSEEVALKQLKNWMSRYERLSNAKLVKLMIKFWAIRRKILGK